MPKDFGLSKNRKENVFNTLPNILKVLRSEDEDIHLVVIVDADHGNNNGYDHAIEKVAKIVPQYGFTLRSSTTVWVLFRHDDDLADFGLWVMPNNDKDDVGRLDKELRPFE